MGLHIGSRPNYNENYTSGGTAATSDMQLVTNQFKFGGGSFETGIIDPYIDLQNTLSLGTQYSIEFFVFHPSTPGTLEPYICISDSARNNSIEITGAGEIRAKIPSNGFATGSNSDFPLSNNTWHHILLVIDTSQGFQMYYDGVRSGNGGTRTNFSSLSPSFNAPFTQLTWKSALYNSVLSGAYIDAIRISSGDPYQTFSANPATISVPTFAMTGGIELYHADPTGTGQISKPSGSVTLTGTSYGDISNVEGGGTNGMGYVFDSNSNAHYLFTTNYITGVIRRFGFTPFISNPSFPVAVSTNSHTYTGGVINSTGGVRDLEYSADGTRYWFGGAEGIDEFLADSGSPYQINVNSTNSTARFVQSLSTPNGGNAGSNFQGLRWGKDGYKLYQAAYRHPDTLVNGHWIVEYDCTIAYDISTATVVNSTNVLPARTTWGGSFDFSPDGWVLFATGSSVMATIELINDPWSLASSNLSSPVEHTALDTNQTGNNLRGTIVLRDPNSPDSSPAYWVYSTGSGSNGTIAIQQFSWQ